MDSYTEAQNKSHAEMLAIMQESLEILKVRGNDYGSDNFIQAAKIASIVTGKDLQAKDVAACLIGIKLARYGNLTGRGIVPKGEAIRDTVSDLINYCGLMERERQKHELLTRTEGSAEKESNVAGKDENIKPGK